MIGLVRNRDFDILVVGGGHAGVEAALASARMGRKAAIVTMDADKLALMSCNPAIGGIGKSQLVKEIDALGGLMAEAADATGIQFRRLNLSRGPAVWSTRAQADRIAYTRFVVDYVSRHRRVDVIEAEATRILTERGHVAGVELDSGEVILAPAVIVASGTFLGGLIHIGQKKIKAGRMGEKAACRLSDSLRELGFEVGRLKTGTPPRLDGDSIDWSLCARQPGEEPPPFFSARSPRRSLKQATCHLTYTTDETKAIVTANFTRSPIFSGQINSRGPRYCPSIETKFHRFVDKERHQIFLEPEGAGTSEIYPNGFSTALPEDLQWEAIRTVVGLERARITKPGYAIEYDFCPAYQIKPSLVTRRLPGLFFAGQINGTSGYEEAAAQGLIAGVNAALQIADEPPLVFDRSEAYIGVMVDDLCTRSTTEPYRMFTSRAEYRLSLREDNARDRLNDYARKYGLVPAEECAEFARLRERTEAAVAHFASTRIRIAELGELGRRFKRHTTVSLANLLKQPNISLDMALPLLARFDGGFSDDRQVVERAAIIIRYSGYVDKQQREIDKFKKMERVRIPDDLDYDSLTGLKKEAIEKLAQYRPGSLGQAGRIEGVTPGDVAVLSVHLRKRGVAFP